MAKIDIQQAPAWVTKLGIDIRAAALRGLLSAALRTKNHIVTEIIPQEPRVPEDRKTYTNAWQVEKLPNGALVYNSAPHAPLIEYGVRAENVKIGRLMIEALTAWVARKGLASKGDEATSMAWAIAKSMQKKGIFNGGKGLGIMKKAQRQIPDFIEEEIIREIGRITK